jgi:TRAP-type C4-dicarboxylate transport system permease large subunit
MMLLAIFAVLLVLGTFMEQISIMLITVPFFFPLAASLGFDQIWFGIIVLLALEISFTTPPFGLLLFVMKGVAPANTTMGEIYKAASPYIFVQCGIGGLAHCIALVGHWFAWFAALGWTQSPVKVFKSNR